MSGFTDKDLWDWERHEQPKEKTIYKAKRSIHWRQPKLKCKTFRNNQVITKGEDRNGRLVFHYYMEGDPHNEHEFRVIKRPGRIQRPVVGCSPDQVGFDTHDLRTRRLKY